MQKKNLALVLGLTPLLGTCLFASSYEKNADTHTLYRNYLSTLINAKQSNQPTVVPELTDQELTDADIIIDTLMTRGKTTYESITTGINAMNYDGSTPLHKAAKNGDLDTMQKILDAGISADTPDGCLGMTPLHWAVFGNQETAASLLLVHHANVNALDAMDLSPLHYAAKEGCEAIALILLGANHVNVDVLSKSLMTPLHYAARYGHRTIARALLKHGANIIAQSQYLMTPLHLATGHGHAAVVQLLLEKEAAVNLKNGGGATPLHLAVGRHYTTMVEMLLGYGADPTITDNFGKTPLQLAEQYEHQDIVALLRVVDCKNIKQKK